MEVNEIIEYLEEHKPIPLFARSKEDYDEYIGEDIEKIDRMITLLKELEAENKVYRNEQSGWVKEIERRQAKIRELEKLDLNVRGLMLENKALKKEIEAYKGMWKEFKKGYSRDGVYFYHDCSDDNDEYVNDVIRELEQTYLGGGE